MIAPPNRVVKFYGPWRDGQAVVEREVWAHSLLRRDGELPVPPAIGRGRLDDDWQYLVVERVPGVALSDVRGELGAEATLGVAEWLGAFVGRLHGLPLTPEERAEGRHAFEEEMRWRHANARTGRGAGLPQRLLSQALDWLPPLEAMLPAASEVVLTHADLKDEHVIGAVSGGTFTPTAVIDFGEARIAHPMYDLPVVWWSALGGDPDLLAVFLRRAGIPGVDAEGFPRLALAWAMVHPSWDAVTLGSAGEGGDCGPGRACPAPLRTAAGRTKMSPSPRTRPSQSSANDPSGRGRTGAAFDLSPDSTVAPQRTGRCPAR